MTPEEAIKFQPSDRCKRMRKRLEGEGQESPSKEPVTLAAPQLPPRPADDRERRLLRLRQEYHLMDDDELWEVWKTSPGAPYSWPLSIGPRVLCASGKQQREAETKISSSV
jgi:hypothetical protein